MKFSPIESFDTSEIEYATYSYLNAIDNSSVLKDGIPTIHYYGTWNNYKLMAMTLLDSKYQRNLKTGHIKALDLLVACREFVKIIKHIHSRGIIHNDSKIQNIIIQNGRGFIFGKWRVFFFLIINRCEAMSLSSNKNSFLNFSDFGLSLDMNEFTVQENIAYAKEDLKRFLYSLFPLVEPRPNWHWLGFGNKDANRMRHKMGFVDDLAKDAVSFDR